MPYFILTFTFISELPHLSSIRLLPHNDHKDAISKVNFVLIQSLFPWWYTLLFYLLLYHHLLRLSDDLCRLELFPQLCLLEAEDRFFLLKLWTYSCLRERFTINLLVRLCYQNLSARCFFTWLWLSGLTCNCPEQNCLRHIRRWYDT